jgi:hypothetical protein
MATKVKPDQLQRAVMAALKNYSGRVNEAMQESVVEVVKWGRKAVSAEARANFKGTRYAKGWTSLVETGRLSKQGTVYNQDVPGLPHLLEHGHAKRGGGRVLGRIHIAPVDEQMQEMVYAALNLRLM